MLQRPGWLDAPVEARGFDFSYTQEYTVFSEFGTSAVFSAKHLQAESNHTHLHKVGKTRKRIFRP